MHNPRKSWFLLLALEILVHPLPAHAEEATIDSAALTFFGWSDQHVQTNGDASHLRPAIEAMNALPGTEYPPDIGGRVDEPAFVFGCGDITEWPTHAAIQAYDQLINQQLKFPAYDVVGNHDEGGKVPSDTATKWLIARHGTLSYTFEQGGVHFIAVHSKYDESLNEPAQPISEEALGFVRDRLSAIPDEVPVIIATHLCFDAMTNRDALIDAIGDAKVLAILGGHYHKAKVNHYREHWFVQLPSPAPGSPDEFTVVRIESHRMIAVPFDYREQRWSNDPQKRLDIQFKERERESVP